jgi:hypothetical protein
MKTGQIKYKNNELKCTSQMSKQPMPSVDERKNRVTVTKSTASWDTFC